MERSRDAQRAAVEQVAPLRYVYILSAGYSGSTLLAAMLGCHPQVESIGQLCDIVSCIRRNEPCTCRTPLQQCEFWRDVLRRAGYWDEERGSVRRVPMETRDGRLHRFLTRLGLRFSPADVEEYRRFNVAVARAVQEVSGRSIIVDSSKMPHRLTWLVRSGAADAWDLRVIYLLRDGRGVLSSYKRRGESVCRSALAWRFRQDGIRAALAPLATDRILQVRYEDLCAAPEPTARRFCDFLGIPFEAAVMDFRSRTQHQVSGNPMRFETTAQIRYDERWRGELTPGDLRAFRLIAGRTQHRLGYPC